MSNSGACFVCNTLQEAEVEFCQCCKARIGIQKWLDILSLKDRSIYFNRLIEAKERWAKFGRYDQSPKNSNPSAISASSNNSVAIGGEFL